MSKLQQILQELRNADKVDIYLVDPDDSNPTALLKTFLDAHSQFDDLLKPILCQPSNEFNGYVQISCKYESPSVHVKVLISQSLVELDEVKYYREMSLEACESLFTLIEPLSKFISAKELSHNKHLERYSLW